MTVTTPDEGAVNGEIDLYHWEPDGEYFDYYAYLRTSNDPHPRTRRGPSPPG